MHQFIFLNHSSAVFILLFLSVSSIIFQIYLGIKHLQQHLSVLCILLSPLFFYLLLLLCSLFFYLLLLCPLFVHLFQRLQLVIQNIFFVMFGLHNLFLQELLLCVWEYRSRSPFSSCYCCRCFLLLNLSSSCTSLSASSAVLFNAFSNEVRSLNDLIWSNSPLQLAVPF